MTSKEALKILFDILCEREHTNSEHNFWLKQYQTVEKDLDILEIIKNKRVDVSFLSKLKSLDDYNSFIFFENDEILSQSEFNILKEWLEDGKSRKIK